MPLHVASRRFIYVFLTFSLLLALFAGAFALSAPIGKIAARTYLSRLLLERALTSVFLTLALGFSLDLLLKRSGRSEK